LLKTHKNYRMSFVINILLKIKIQTKNLWKPYDVIGNKYVMEMKILKKPRKYNVVINNKVCFTKIFLKNYNIILKKYFSL
jgi:hypothetical protein